MLCNVIRRSSLAAEPLSCTAMKITHIENYPTRILLMPARLMITALGRHTESLYLLARVGADAGTEGVGEATVMPAWSGGTVWEALKTIDPDAQLSL